MVDKRCPSCKETKPATAFSRHAGRRDGLSWMCKPCVKAWQAVNAETMRATRRARPEGTRRAASKFYFANLEKVRARKAEYLRLNPERNRAKTAANRAKRANAPGEGITTAQRKDLIASALGMCVYCGRRDVLTLDHVEPLLGGGAHDVDNAVAACGPCNSSKGSRILVVWLASRPRLVYDRNTVRNGTHG